MQNRVAALLKSKTTCMEYYDFWRKNIFKIFCHIALGSYKSFQQICEMSTKLKSKHFLKFPTYVKQTKT